jgi:protein O-GlcNAcase/histone acetyltransferase
VQTEARTERNEGGEFLAGVIEGFYGPPWLEAERLELFEWMADWGLTTYLYAPKDDLKHRAIWREAYSASEANELSRLIKACSDCGIQFIYALSPGLDIRYSEIADFDCLVRRFDQTLGLGVRHFALLFDDVPDRINSNDLAHYGSLASAQASIANRLFEWIRRSQPKASLFFCPTPYCERMASRGIGGENYLATIGAALIPEVDVFWTGPEIISQEISLSHARDLGQLLQRKPVIWDNLHANDYDGRRFFCGPYSGRQPELRAAVAGLLVNPNCEFRLNYVPLRTFAQFVRFSGAWNSRDAYLSALQEWLPAFSTVGTPITMEDLLLFTDCYYLPHSEGPLAERLYEDIRDVITRPPAEWSASASSVRQGIVRLRDFCTRLAELQNRPLFHALSRRAWELREEMDLLERYLHFRSMADNAELPFRSDSHLPATYRGGMVARLQQLLVPHSDGTIRLACDVSPSQPRSKARKSRAQG